MKKNATACYALTQLMLWGEYGFLLSYATNFLTERLRLTNTLAGVLLAAATAGAFLAQPALTALIDRKNVPVRRVLICVAALNAVFCVLVLLTRRSVALTSVMFVLASVCLQVQPSFSNALAMQGIRSGMRINFGIARGLGSVSFGVCCRIAPVLIAVKGLGLNAVPLFAALTAALLAASAAVFPRTRAVQAQAEERPATAAEFFRTNRKFVGLLLGVILLYIGHNVLSNYMFRIAQSKLLPGATQTAESLQGTALMIAAVVELPTMFLFVRLVRRVRCDLLLLLSCAFMTLRLLLTVLLPGALGLCVAQLTQMGGYALFAVSTVYYVGTVIAKRDVVKGQTYLGAANTMGSLLAYLCGGMLIDATGTPNMLWICFGVSLLGLLLCGLFRERVQKAVGT